jgi:hypothetical protein
MLHDQLPPSPCSIVLIDKATRRRYETDRILRHPILLTSASRVARTRQTQPVLAGVPLTTRNGLYSCELSREEQKRDTRYTGASLPESEVWVEQPRRNLNGVR